MTNESTTPRSNKDAVAAAAGNTGTGDIEMGLTSSSMNPSHSLMSVPGSAASIDSLPVASAEPDAMRNESVLVATRDVIPIGMASVPRDEDPWSSSGPRPSLISLVCYKETVEHSLGVSFRSVDGILKIGSINQEGPVGRTSLRVGDEVIGLDNHRHCSRWSAVQAARFVKRSVGHVSMLVSIPSGDPNIHAAMVFKAQPDDRVGIVFRNDEQNRLVIRSLRQSGLIGKMSALNEGDFVESINMTTAHNLDAEVAKAIVRSTPDIVSIVTKRTDAVQISLRNIDKVGASAESSADEKYVGAMEVNAMESEMPVVDLHTSGFGVLELDNIHQSIDPMFVYVQCDKPTMDTKLGISFEDSGPTLTIANINGSGVLWASPLKKGFGVLAIDGNVASSWTKMETIEYFKSRQTGITILARNPAGNARYVVAQASKDSPRAKVGLSFRKVGSGPLKVGVINPDSIFAGSILNEDDDAIRVNGIPAESLSATEAVSIVEYATDTVTIVARTNSKNGIVLASMAPGEVPPGVPFLNIPQVAAEDTNSGRHANIAVGVCCCLLVMFFVFAI